MSQSPVQALPPVAREEHVRIGPISVFALIIIICMAVLAVLTLSTANASLVLSQRQAVATQELYLNETAAQAFVAEVDDLITAGGGASGIESSLPSMCSVAEKAANGQVEATAQLSNQQIDAEFSCENGRILKITVSILDDGAYRIDKWKMTAVENVEQPMGNLYTGA